MGAFDIEPGQIYSFFSLFIFEYILYCNSTSNFNIINLNVILKYSLVSKNLIIAKYFCEN